MNFCVSYILLLRSISQTGSEVVPLSKIIFMSMDFPSSFVVISEKSDQILKWTYPFNSIAIHLNCLYQGLVIDLYNQVFSYNT